MSNNQRWVRIPTFEEFEQLMAIPNVTIAQLSSSEEIRDVESFASLINYQKDSVSVLDAASYINYTKEPFKSFYGGFNEVSYRLCFGFDSSYKKAGYFAPTAENRQTQGFFSETYFNPLKLRGFYLLEEAEITVTRSDIRNAADIPADGIVYNPDDAERFICEYPKGFYQVFSKGVTTPSVIPWVNLKESDLASLEYHSQHISVSSKPITLDLRTKEGLSEIARHLNETFVSGTGDTPDEWFDKQNEGVI